MSTRRRTVSVTTISLAMVLAVSGCANTADPDAGASPSSAPASATATPSQSATPSTAPSTTPAPTETATDPAAIDCASLLDPETIEQNEADGAELTDQDEYAAKLKDEGNSFYDFVEYGGVICQMGIPNSDGVVLWAYGPITDDQAAKKMNSLEKSDEADYETGPNENGGTYYSAGDDREIYVFSPAGYWAYSLDNGFPNVIEEVVKNAPAFY